jgi:ABC-type spermidine/putrescine transport system permease subunit II
MVGGSSMLWLLWSLALLAVTVAQPGTPSPTIHFTYPPTPTADWASEAPTGAATITHNPDWTEAQLISVILGSLVGLLAVVLAVYCAYARGCWDEPKLGNKKAEMPSASSPLLRPAPV